MAGWVIIHLRLFCYLRFPDSVQFTNNSKKRCTSRTQANAKCRTRAPQKRSGFPVGNLRLHSVAQSSPFDSLIAQKIEQALTVNFTKGGKDHDLAIWSGSPSPPPNSVPLCRADKNIRNPPLGLCKIKRTNQTKTRLAHSTLRPLFRLGSYTIPPRKINFFLYFSNSALNTSRPQFCFLPFDNPILHGSPARDIPPSSDQSARKLAHDLVDR